MEALKAIKIIGNQNDGRAVFLCLPNTGSQRVLNFMRDPKLAHILVHDWNVYLEGCIGGGLSCIGSSLVIIKSLCLALRSQVTKILVSDWFSEVR